MIWHDAPWETVVLLYIVQVEFCYFQSSHGLIVWDEFDFFWELINDNKNGIEVITNDMGRSVVKLAVTFIQGM